MPTGDPPCCCRRETFTQAFPPTMPPALRDYFAAVALGGMLAADGNDPRWTGRDTGPECQAGGGKWLDPAGVAKQAYEIADAMLKVRSGNHTEDE
jgi:hypothetical protein